MKNVYEKRADDRTVLKQTLSFELSITGSGRLSNTVEVGTGVDLSPGGIGITTAYPLKGGEVVKLFFPVTTGQTKLPVFTEVMWASPAGTGIRAGLRFLT